MTNINEMFAATENQETATSSRSLAGTAQLTNIATALTADAMQKINDDFENYKDSFMASQKEHSAMDAFIAELLDLSSVDVEFLKELDEDVIDGMLKSQQSKRSRAKGKQMTRSNYTSMMTGAIAETLIRLATGKAKSAGGARRASGSVKFTDEQLVELQANQDQLRKELRNVQSKKSIMKSKVGFTEEDDRWQQLLVAEEQLKAIRVTTGGARVVKVDETKAALEDVMADLDIEHLKAADSKELLSKIKAMIG